MSVSSESVLAGSHTRWKCPFCVENGGRYLSSLQALKTHVLSLHGAYPDDSEWLEGACKPGEVPLRCPCGEWVTSFEGLVQHCGKNKLAACSRYKEIAQELKRRTICHLKARRLRNIPVYQMREATKAAMHALGLQWPGRTQGVGSGRSSAGPGPSGTQSRPAQQTGTPRNETGSPGQRASSTQGGASSRLNVTLRSQTRSPVRGSDNRTVPISPTSTLPKRRRGVRSTPEAAGEIPASVFLLSGSSDSESSSSASSSSSEVASEDSDWTRNETQPSPRRGRESQGERSNNRVVGNVETVEEVDLHGAFDGWHRLDEEGQEGMLREMRSFIAFFGKQALYISHHQWRFHASKIAAKCIDRIVQNPGKDNPAADPPTIALLVLPGFFGFYTGFGTESLPRS